MGEFLKQLRTIAPGYWLRNEITVRLQNSCSSWCNPAIAFQNSAYNVISGSTGFKINPSSRFIVTVNALFRLNHSGLHSKVAPLIGLSYTL